MAAGTPRIIQAVFVRVATLAGQASFAMEFHTYGGPTFYDVPTDFVLLLHDFISNCSTNQVLVFRVTTRQRVYHIPIGGGAVHFKIPYPIESGDRVTIDVFNPSAATGAGTTYCGMVRGILVPSVDWETQQPAALAPYFPPIT